MLMMAFVTDERTGKKKFIESEYDSKSEFIRDLRGNGYAVNPIRVKEKEVYEHILKNTNCEAWIMKMSDERYRELYMKEEVVYCSKYIRNDVDADENTEFDLAIMLTLLNRVGEEKAREFGGERFDELFEKYTRLMDYHYELKCEPKSMTNVVDYVNSCINLTNEFGESNARRLCGVKYDSYMEKFAVKVMHK